MATVEIQGLSKKYGKRVGVDNVSLQITDKEFVAVFGPAGAGKTTTLNLIAGIVTPDRGNVRIGSRDVGGLEPAERNVAMVFESYALYPQLTVFENMAFPLRSPKYGLPEDQVKERVTQYAKVLKIDHLVDRPIQALSNGQRQRTALGRALVRKPDVFLLDEPLSHLDAKLRHSMRAELKEMRQQLGTTTIYVTHDYLEAMSLGDRIVILDQGRILQVGTPDEIYFRPASTRVAGLFGDPEINLVDAQITPGADGVPGVRMFGEGGALPLTAELAAGRRNHDSPGILVGFRPADVEILPADVSGAMQGTVYSFEPLGTKCVLTLTVADGSRVRSLTTGRAQFRADDRVGFRINAHDLIFFRPGSGEYLTRSELTREEA